MVKKQLDVYYVLGIVVSFFGVAINYIAPGKIPLVYLLIGLGISSGLIAFIIQISFILSKFSDVNDRLKKFGEKIEVLELETSSLKQTFKTERELNNIRLDIKELQTKILK